MHEKFSKFLEIKKVLLWFGRFWYSTNENFKYRKTPAKTNVEKITSVNTTPPKLIHLSFRIIAKHLMLAVNCSLNQGILSYEAQIAAAILLGKVKPYKNDIVNYRTVRLILSYITNRK